MANILPDNLRRLNKRRYVIRLSTVVFYGLAFVLVVCTALIVPSYFLLNEEAKALTAERVRMETDVVDTDFRVLPLGEITERAKELTLGVDRFSPTSHIQTIVGTLPQGVSLNSISFEKGESMYTFTISGMADTREALVAFRDALDGLTRFSGVDLPVTQLARRTDLEFSLTANIQP